MENENVIGKVCFAILRKGFVAGLRISLELDSPGCIIGCKFDGAGMVQSRHLGMGVGFCLGRGKPPDPCF